MRSLPNHQHSPSSRGNENLATTFIYETPSYPGQLGVDTHPKSKPLRLFFFFSWKSGLRTSLLNIRHLNLGATGQ